MLVVSEASNTGKPAALRSAAYLLRLWLPLAAFRHDLVALLRASRSDEVVLSIATLHRTCFPFMSLELSGVRQPLVPYNTKTPDGSSEDRVGFLHLSSHCQPLVIGRARLACRGR